MHACVDGMSRKHSSREQVNNLMAPLELGKSSVGLDTGPSLMLMQLCDLYPNIYGSSPDPNGDRASSVTSNEPSGMRGPSQESKGSIGSHAGKGRKKMNKRRLEDIDRNAHLADRC